MSWPTITFHTRYTATFESTYVPHGPFFANNMLKFLSIKSGRHIRVVTGVNSPLLHKRLTSAKISIIFWVSDVYDKYILHENTMCHA